MVQSTQTETAVQESVFEDVQSFDESYHLGLTPITASQKPIWVSSDELIQSRAEDSVSSESYNAMSMGYSLDEFVHSRLNDGFSDAWV
jgi:hypothetical protein